MASEGEIPGTNSMRQSIPVISSQEMEEKYFFKKKPTFSGNDPAYPEAAFACGNPTQEAVQMLIAHKHLPPP